MVPYVKANKAIKMSTNNPKLFLGLRVLEYYEIHYIFHNPDRLSESEIKRNLPTNPKKGQIYRKLFFYKPKFLLFFHGTY